MKNNNKMLLSYYNQRLVRLEKKSSYYKLYGGKNQAKQLARLEKQITRLEEKINQLTQVRKQVIDKLAAGLILQSYLDSLSKESENDFVDFS